MDYEIEQNEWIDFLRELSKRRHGWKTRVEILNNDTGDQILTDGLPLNGITTETRNGILAIDFSFGETPDQHQTHIIVDPKRVAFLPQMETFHDVLDIEEGDGTKTLVKLIEPMPLMTGYHPIMTRTAAT